MTPQTATIEGTLQPDGITVQLDRKAPLPPGRVTVEVRPAAPAAGPTMLEVLDRIHQAQRGRGQGPMTEDEMARAIERARAEDDEYEARWRAIWAETRPDSGAGRPDGDLPR
jgi:hypothetical protein